MRPGEESRAEPAPLFRELFALSYGNLAMAHYALEKGDQAYTRTAYMVRARLTKGLRTGEMAVGSLFSDEKLKLSRLDKCSYCGAGGPLALDHLIPKKLGGPDSGDNLVPSCRSCNSSKGGKDVLVWHQSRGEFPPLMILRRYLKLALLMVQNADLLDSPVDAPGFNRLPIVIELIPTARFPLPPDLRL